MFKEEFIVEKTELDVANVMLALDNETEKYIKTVKKAFEKEFGKGVTNQEIEKVIAKMINENLK